MAVDILRDIDELLLDSGFEHSIKRIGGFGTVELYLDEKRGSDSVVNPTKQGSPD